MKPSRMAAMIARVIALLAVLGLLLAPLSLAAAQEDETASIALILVLDGLSGWHDVDGGTAFLVGSDGSALTNAHVVRKAADDPRYRLLVIIGREFYGANLICGTRSTGDRYDRDVASIRLVPPAFPFTRWGIGLPNGERYEYEAHKGPLPEFPTLRLADHNPSPGMPVRIPGYSHVSALPRVHVGIGIIRRTFLGADGATQIIESEMTNPTQPGASGSPILDASGQVVGVHAWGNGHTQEEGVSVSVFRDHPC